MIRHYTRDELVDEWKRRLGLIPVQAGASAELHGGNDIDRMVGAAVDRWYRDLLEEAPEGAIALVDLARELTAARTPTGAAEVRLPEKVVSVRRVRMAGWERNAVIAAAGSPEDAAQTNEWSRAGAVRPVAITNGLLLTLYSPAGDDLTIEQLLCAVTPDPDGDYAVDPAVLPLPGAIAAMMPGASTKQKR